MLLTGRLNVVVGASLPGAVTLTALFRPSGHGSKSKPVARKKVQLSSGSDGRSVTLKVGRTSRKAMRAAGGQLVVTSVTDSPGRTPLTKTAAVAVSRSH
jgi:hypothetical protein